MSQYDFTKTPCAPDRLAQEIQQSAIVTALNHITLLGSALSVVFNDTLSEGDQTLLTTLVSNHNGTPLAQNTSVVLSPFASKKIGSKNLYKRVVGSSHALSPGANNILLTITQAWVKLKALEILCGELGDTSDLLVLDSTTGTYTGDPNHVLNQFGFSVNIAKDFYSRDSEYDADLYVGMQLKLVYNSVSAKTTRVNLILNEVV